MNSTVLQEWLSPASVSYLASCLQECKSSAMVADLREFVPSQALKAATERLSQAKRQQIKTWVIEQNSQKEVAA